MNSRTPVLPAHIPRRCGRASIALMVHLVPLREVWPHWKAGAPPVLTPSDSRQDTTLTMLMKHCLRDQETGAGRE